MCDLGVILLGEIRCTPRGQGVNEVIFFRFVNVTHSLWFNSCNDLLITWWLLGSFHEYSILIGQHWYVFFSLFKDQVGTLVMSDMAENALVSTLLLWSRIRNLKSMIIRPVHVGFFSFLSWQDKESQIYDCQTCRFFYSLSETKFLQKHNHMLLLILKVIVFLKFTY